MPSRSPSVGPILAGRTGHACVQCRQRKQKCGGFTRGIQCRTCATRKVKCSFEDEVKDPRYNPYLRLQPSLLPPVAGHQDDSDAENIISASDVCIPPIPEFDGESLPALQSPAPLARPTLSTAAEALAKQVDSLSSRIADLENQIISVQKGHAEVVDTSRSRAGTSFTLNPENGPSQHYYRSNSDIHSLSTPQAAVITEGPLKALNNFQTDDPVELQSQDPIARSVITEGEAYFSNCHPNAPFLDVELDSDVDRVRSRSTLLFLAILAVGARFWSASSKSSCWLHPRYSDLVRLLDTEVMRVTLRPGPDDQKLETVQALLLCAHWMPFDITPDRTGNRSRFSETGAWQCLGLAIRWATSLAFERSCHLSFRNLDTVTQTDVRQLRTMLYLTESDHYLALSARRSSYLDPEPLNAVLNNFLSSTHVRDTDFRLISLFRVAYSAHFTGCRPTTIESVEAFDRDVLLVERHFTSSLGDRSKDSFNRHFPFTSLRWYRLSYACAFLDTTDPTQRTGKALTWALEWASQILIHLSGRQSLLDVNNRVIPIQLEPDPSVVEILSFAIDHYFVVIAFAAFFLVNSWLSNFTDLNLGPHVQQTGATPIEAASGSLIFRLVDVAARTLEAASPPEGHLARRYIPLLRRMMDIILSGNTHAQRTNDRPHDGMANSNTIFEQSQNTFEGDLWEMWQQAGMDATVWPSMFDDVYEQR